ncbi:nucleotidyltransferase family protein [Pseudobacteriovorax antillogorgiicola]|uniref:Mannose-1-phosphate guanylyltransferase n=1 Tax=Pseudobacteriovorax antillogorgiicola TaxID=1513793 RepID=A0A1Y6B453_9BACT|nr:sugar phosphate nucleotidyltransferase [Pseudobacteriovorax antillogorgiicola]TCS59174.1 mannose-1-phosphate guanylyltransferase [Pseudobacteriovorax antillogorgiicola]SME90903.1 mannose-1-phosphate guanylyltransferase [Pseudobacteriovorax antillogorgiicola]
MKSLILAAGFGTRLRPLTNSRPKPLCPFFGVPFLELALSRVSKEAKDIAVNTHYLGETIEKYLALHHQEKPLKVFHEPEIRGTGGALFPLRSWLGDEPLLIYNADIISNIDISRVINAHRKSNSIATMVMLPHAIPLKTPVYCQDSQVLAFGDKPPSSNGKFTFSGIHIVSSEFVSRIPETVPWSVIDTYKKLIAEGHRVQAYFHSGFWSDLGTPQSLWESHIEVLKSNPNKLLSELGVTEARAKFMYPSLVCDTKNHSAWRDTINLQGRCFNSLVDSDQSIQQTIHDSLIIHPKMTIHNQPIQRRLYIDEVELSF